MTTIIIARDSAIAHFFDVEQQSDSDVRKALCGFVCLADDFVPMPSLSGALPCELCIRDIPDDLLWPRRESAAEAFPVDEQDSSRTYAVGLRGEFVWHDVPDHPTMQVYEGREVVITECGCIAFLVFGTPLPRYERCTDCPTDAEVCSK